MKLINVSTTSKDIEEALQLVGRHLNQDALNDIPGLSQAVKHLLAYIVQSIYEAIDPYDEPSLSGEIEQFDSQLLDKVIHHVQQLAEDPLLKPLLKQGKIRDITFLNDEGLILLELESKHNGHARPIPTFKASLF